MLFALKPFTVVGSTIGPEINSIAALSVVNVGAHEDPAVAPLVDTLSVHHVVLPIAQEESVVVPDKESSTIEHVLAPFSNVSVSIWPLVLSLALFAGVLVKALVHARVIPLFFSKAVLFVLVPISNVLAPVCMSVNAETLGHVVHKFTLVQVPTGVIELSSTIIEIILPESFINCSIWPPHDSIALLDSRVVLEHLT